MKQIVPNHSTVSTVVEPLDMMDVRNDSVEMHRVMKGLHSAGFPSYALSHCQINNTRPLRYFTMNPNVDGWPGPYLILNPSFEGVGSKKLMKEKCLSFPNKPPVDVYRYYKIHVTFYDELWNKTVTNLKGIHAQIFQHEIQHFDGKSIYDSLITAGIVLPTNAV